jgi:hypothetical protein
MTTARTAYILQIHKNPEQVNKFIQQLIADDQADVFVHIDKKSVEKLNGKIIKSPNVIVLEHSISCDWGDRSQIDTTILLLREVLATKRTYDYVCLRSGQDLLVKDGFKEFLLENKGKIFMNFRDVGKKELVGMEINWPKITRRRYNNAHPFRVCRRIIYDFYMRGINLLPNTNYWPKDYTFYNGSQWFTIPLEVASYIIDFLDENEWYYKFFERTLAPDEWFFQTLIMNSPFKSDVVKDNLLYLRWGETFIDRGSPVYLTMEDIPLIENSNDYFARKFDKDVDYSVIEYFTNKFTFSGKELVSSQK